MSSEFPISPKIVRAGEGQRLELRGEVRHLLLDSRDTGGALSLAHSQFQKGSGSPMHAHTREDEWFLVLRGQFEFHFGGYTSLSGSPHYAGPSEFVFGPRHIPHSYTCISEGGGELLIGIADAGFEEFFRSLAAQSEAAAPLDFPTIRALAATFGVVFDDFDSLPAPDSSPRIGHIAEAECLEAFGDQTLVLIASDETANRFCLAQSETPSFGGPPCHLHEREDEVFIISAGRYEFQIGDARVQAEVGDTIFAPRGVPHTFRVVSNEPGRFLLFTTPGGFDQFFRECAELWESGDVTPHRIGAIATTHKLRFLPPEA